MKTIHRIWTNAWKDILYIKTITLISFGIIEVIETSIQVTYGKSGTSGVTKTKESKNASTAQKNAEKLCKEKAIKGYLEITELITPPNDGRFSDNEFWELIEGAKSKAHAMDVLVKQLTDLLAQRTKDDIITFACIFYKYYRYSYKSRLWAAAYIINSGCSDDAFDYFRAWLIAQGKCAYFAALSNPDWLARGIPIEDAGTIECEDMLSVARTAYALKTGEHPEKLYDFIPSELMQLPEIEIDWDEENDDDLKNMLPALWEKFGNK